MKNLITLVLAVLCAFPSAAVQAKLYLAAPPQSRDTWRSVRTNNLFVIGNADAEKLRQVAAWLEFFHTAFARLVSRNVIDSSTPTTVIIFRDDASFTPFKPLYQGRPANVAGFFQPGDDVNYIALALDPTERDPYGTAFHEYIHLHLKDNVPGAPTWLNEGLAELYGSLQFSGTEALLGAPLPYARLLRDNELLPLTTLLSIGTNSPHYNEADKSGIFYGESWALVHYLMLGERGRQEQFRRFLQLVSRGDDATKAIQDAFGMSIDVLQQDFEAYVRRGNFSAQRLDGVNPQSYASYTAMQRSSLTEAEVNHYLGDLLLHIGRDTDAERYFKQAVAFDPGFAAANASLGRLYVHQRRYADAKKYLQKATSQPQNYLTHYLYAFVLSREGVSANGMINGYSRENAAIMREQLLQAIKLAPDHAPSYHLLALVDVVTGERLDEALEMAQKANRLAPSKSAQELIEAIEQRSTGASRTPAINSAAIAEPAISTSVMLGGATSSVVIRDGQTIEKSASLPSADELIAKYYEATGGVAAYQAETSRIIKGTIDLIGVSRGESIESYAVAPDKFLTVIESRTLGTQKRGYNGRVAWTRTSAGLKILKGQELASFKDDADFYAFMKFKTYYAKLTVAGISKIGYRDMYVLEAQTSKGSVDRIYFDKETFLVARINTVRTLGPASGEVEIYLDDWRELEGIKIPFSLTFSFGKRTLVLTVKEIQRNVPIDARMFDP